MRIAVTCILLTVLLARGGSFEVATVRINRTGSVGDTERYHDGLLRMSNVTLKQCIRYGYGISEPQIAGGPSWINDLRFDIVAKAEYPPADDTELLTMLQPLLADRFQLAVHHETRTMPGYALIAARNGIRAKLSDPNTKFSGSSTHTTMTVTGCTMQVLAIRLSPILGRPVVDMTQDPHAFDFSLRWAPEGEVQTGASATASDEGSLFTALQEQVGVKLESRKVPVDVLVIDRAELPSEN
jgi:uncharacterized protein (TIGR03435 family)